MIRIEKNLSPAFHNTNELFNYNLLLTLFNFIHKSNILKSFQIVLND